MRAVRAYLWLEGGRAYLFALIFTASTLYQVQVVGLTALQLVLVGTVLEATYFVFQIPTGVIADVYTRRGSVLLGVAVTGIAFMVEGLIPSFVAVLTAQVLWGIGATLVDGALEAWISDEVGETQVAQVFLRAGQIGGISSVAGIISSVLLANWLGVSAPVWIGGALLIMLVLSLLPWMPEVGFTRKETVGKNPWVLMRETARSGLSVIRSSPVLIVLTLISLVNGLYSEGFDRLSTAHLVRNIGFPAIFGQTFSEITWLAAIGIAGTWTGVALNGLTRRKLDTENDHAVTRWLIGGTALMVGAMLVFVWGGSLWLTALALCLADGLRGVLHSLVLGWTNRRISSEDSSVRATVLSIWSQADALGQVAGGPVVGAVGNASIRLALTVSAALLALKLPMFSRIRKAKG
jgi:MFS transporter, DHA3 family, tetracycline resistance protein